MEPLDIDLLKAEIRRASMLGQIGQVDAAINVLRSAHLSYVSWWNDHASRAARQVAVQENIEGSLLDCVKQLQRQKIS